MMPADIDATFTPTTAREVIGVELDGEAVLYHEVANTIHVLSPSATIVWNFLDGDDEVAAIVTQLADAFSVPHDRMLNDVLVAVREFGRLGLLEGIESDPASVAANVLQAPEPGAKG